MSVLSKLGDFDFFLAAYTKHLFRDGVQWFCRSPISSANVYDVGGRGRLMVFLITSGGGGCVFSGFSINKNRFFLIRNCGHQL